MGLVTCQAGPSHQMPIHKDVALGDGHTPGHRRRMRMMGGSDGENSIDMVHGQVGQARCRRLL